MIEDPKTYSIVRFEIIDDSTLKIYYCNKKTQTIDFAKIKKNGWRKQLSDPQYFKQVKINEVDNLEWPGGNDFHPEHLYHWDKFEEYYLP